MTTLHSGMIRSLQMLSAPGAQEVSRLDVSLPWQESRQERNIVWEQSFQDVFVKIFRDEQKSLEIRDR